MNMAIATVESEPEHPAINSPSDAPSPEVWSVGVQVLHDLLQQGGGIVSSRALRQALEQKHVPDARRLVLSLKYFDFDAPPEEGHPKPPFRWFSHAKSLYSEERYAKLQSVQEQQAAKAEQVLVADVQPEEEELQTPPLPPPPNPQQQPPLRTHSASTPHTISQSAH